MKILIHSPLIDGVRTGNRSSAEQWRSVMVELGHEVDLISEWNGQESDWLVGLHASKCAIAVAACRRDRPGTKIAVVLTGTDIYPQPEPAAVEAMELADLLVGLQPDAAEQVPEGLRSKVRVIVQASPPFFGGGTSSQDDFEVCVVGHLRDVKDPMLTAKASRLLPCDSKVRVLHAGAILDSRFESLVEQEQRDNPRYQWLGQLGATEVRQLIASSRLLVLSSLSEGAGRVIGSAISKGTPVLSTCIHGVVGLVGKEYPGLFPVGDAEALAALLDRAETDRSFMDELGAACEARGFLFEPERELAGWRNLLEEKTNG